MPALAKGRIHFPILAFGYCKGCPIKTIRHPKGACPFGERFQGKTGKKGAIE
jgi:hypothetical protein